MKIDGACHCGRITYEAEVDPEAVAICHCTDCKPLSASAFRTFVPARREAFRLHGTPERPATSGSERRASAPRSFPGGRCGAARRSRGWAGSAPFRASTSRANRALPPISRRGG